ncbi:pilus assembly FimT family protein [Psychrobacter sp. UBA2769]|uniref:pilus assembly FimT family protein n=1 Tax=Psychrobacter sp. UBA2769 TaxID=1947348 RepID=UPI0025E1DDB9|nr:prepilin-type N-terminal cleavage/methylation domain-containing protein [Psychrobacter sp. UBA2769]
MMKSYKVLPTRQKQFQPNNEQGFTLVELIVTIAVLAILTMIATPYILEQLARMEAKRIESQIRNTLTLAKAESYIRRQDLLVCLSNNGAICDRDSYKQLLLFLDRNNNKNFDLGVDDLLEEQALEPKYSTLYLRVGDKRHYTKFWGDSGKPRGHFGHFKYCPTSTYNHTMYQISFSQGGRVTYKPNASHPTDCGK